MTRNPFARPDRKTQAQPTRELTREQEVQLAEHEALRIIGDMIRQFNGMDNPSDIAIDAYTIGTDPEFFPDPIPAHYWGAALETVLDTLEGFIHRRITDSRKLSPWAAVYSLFPKRPDSRYDGQFGLLAWLRHIGALDNDGNACIIEIAGYGRLSLESLIEVYSSSKTEPLTLADAMERHRIANVFSDEDRTTSPEKKPRSVAAIESAVQDAIEQIDGLKLFQRSAQIATAKRLLTEAGSTLDAATIDQLANKLRRTVELASA